MTFEENIKELDANNFTFDHGQGLFMNYSQRKVFTLDAIKLASSDKKNLTKDMMREILELNIKWITYEYYKTHTNNNIEKEQETLT